MENKRGVEKERVEEMLELLWTLKESGHDDLQLVFKKSGDAGPDEVLDELRRNGFVTLDGDRVSLTAAGDGKAREIVRRYRLAEVLLAQVLELEDTEVRNTACKFEHVLSPKATDSICTFLGHPPVCPHGKSIPKGSCCLRADTKLKPLITRLTEMEVGALVTAVFIAPSLHRTLDRLAGFGIVPGSTFRVHQRDPSCVIQIGETTVALDEEIAREIHVRRA
ncbi:MAG: metal-dependent transcriptional regulator [Candidatus Eisenbacteria bacterium]